MLQRAMYEGMLEMAAFSSSICDGPAHGDSGGE
jgi:hypothetical protein